MKTSIHPQSVASKTKSPKPGPGEYRSAGVFLRAEDLYDGPFCVLSIVDNRTYKRLFYRVLEHSPKQGDIEDFFGCFQAVLQARQLVVKGITTDGSSLYPAALSEVFGEVPHQLCQFHIVRDINQAVLSAIAPVRKSLTARTPKVGRGRPTAKTRKLVRQGQRLERKVADLFTYRHLFVQRHLTASEQDTLQRLTRGLPHLRALREIMDEVYRLFDRRCRTETALTFVASLTPACPTVYPVAPSAENTLLDQSRKGLDLLG
jgi:hypothetical protein